MIRFILFLSFVFVLGGQPASAFDDTSGVKRTLMIGFLPQYIFIHGLKVEYNHGISHKKLAFISPDYYSGQLGFRDSGTVKGAGVQVGVKYLFNGIQPGSRKFAYIGFSAQYNFFRINTNAFKWVAREEDGLTFYEYLNSPVYTNFHRLGLDVFCGFTKVFDNNVYTEFTTGASIRESSMKPSEGYTPVNRHDQVFWDFGFSGVTPILNMKVGVLIR